MRLIQAKGETPHKKLYVFSYAVHNPLGSASYDYNNSNGLTRDPFL